MTRIDQKFKELRKARKKAFIAFITAGYPSLATTGKLIMEFERRGVDIIEIGVPFSDPMADGPVIQEASHYALTRGITLHKILAMVKSVRAKGARIPICLMTYYNPVFCFGDAAFLKAAKASGVDGLIIPDLPPEESKVLRRVAEKIDIDIISFIAPTTSPGRVRSIAAQAKGFIYYVSLTGVTGARQALPSGLAQNLALIKRATNKPVCVGFGVSTSSQVRQVSALSDGVIVGSAIVRSIKENFNSPGLVARVGGLVSQLKGK